MVLELRDHTDKQRMAIAARCATVIGTHGDDLQFGGRHCVEAVNALARGLAVAAYQPGGVTFAGLHWCTVRHDGCPACPGDELGLGREGSAASGRAGS